jgi:hypothetical protein
MDNRAPPGYDIDADGRLVPKPPLDTIECVWACRAIEQIAESRRVSVEAARGIAVEAIEQKELTLRARLMREPSASREPESVFAAVSPTTFTAEGWLECLTAGQFDWRDERPWIQATARRGIPVPHWLFVTRKSFDAFLSAQAKHAKPERSPQLRQASESMIRKTIRSVYDIALAACAKRPNIAELPKVVQPILEADGYGASQRRIQVIGSESEFVKLRGQSGKRLTSEKQSSAE